MAAEMSANPHPVTYFVTPQLTDRNRLTCAFRWILIIPHAILVGGVSALGVGAVAGVFLIAGNSNGNYSGFGGEGVLGVVASVMAIISWFAIVFTGNQPKGLWDFINLYLRWKSKVIAYGSLLRDEYPPFGDGDYPVQFGVAEFPTQRNRMTVAIRLIMIIPHAVVLFFLSIAWFFAEIIAWFSILFTGNFPEGLYRFVVGYLRWSIRVESYMLLMHDEYPPFSLD